MNSDPLSQSAPTLYDSSNAWEDAPASHSLHTSLSTDKPLPALEERERERQQQQHTQQPPRSRNSSTLSIPSTAKIYGQPTAPLAQPSVITTAGSNSIKSSNNHTTTADSPPFLKIRVTGITKNRRDYLVEFDASTNIPDYDTGGGTATSRNSSVYRGVQRTYDEVTRLSEQLTQAHPSTIIPALPANSSNAQSEEEDDRRVRLALQRWFDRVSGDVALHNDSDMRAFIMNKFSYVPVQLFKPRGGGINFKLSNKLPNLGLWGGGGGGAAVTKEEKVHAAYSDDPTNASNGSDATNTADENEDTNAYLIQAQAVAKDQEKALQRVVGTLEMVIRRQRDSATAETSVSERLLTLSGAERVHMPSLAHSLEKLSRCAGRMGEVGLRHCAGELVTLYDGLIYCARDARAVRYTLVQRNELQDDYQRAVQRSISKRRAVERMKGGRAINVQRADSSLGELREAQTVEDNLAQQVQLVGLHLHQALAVHDKQTEEDLVHLLSEHAALGVEHSRLKIGELQAVQRVVEGMDVGGSGSVEGGVEEKEKEQQREYEQEKKQEKKQEKTQEQEQDEEQEQEQEQNQNKQIKQTNSSDPLGASASALTGRVDTSRTTLSQSSVLPAQATPTPTSASRESMSQSTASISRHKADKKRINAREAATKLAGGF
ncbi:hypothetical protein E3P92_02521 [Wallemia ichthyophaga]|nr:hypothetical protein E3P97_02536 [Wallemia ichthyophaga]TIB06767.1 hypothetical protein E3P96_00125 [Wallemia ichthyophaga]TIB12732.1 hypothetical protein E3P92_02521 [Wallemia ichthyophaga]TIB31562.1 hypothetical protein E3P85_02252 [Wallemia ichthyophaga]TIB45925.1 hypothetical protein E3P82_02528 [Wallemia ichthyophaga]